MPPIRSTDLVTRLLAQATEGLKRADANKSGVVTKAEDAGLPAELKQEVASFRTSNGSVRATTFLSKFEADVRAEVARVDSNHDGMISDADQARLATWLKDNVAALGAVVTPTPTGELRGDLDTGLGANALNGLAEVNGKLYAADGKSNRLLEISVRI